MRSYQLLEGTVHDLPSDLRTFLLSQKNLPLIWQSLTPLARNEWICWIISAKKVATRKRRMLRIFEELTKGKRRPCCWAGCAHRKMV